MSLNLYSGKLVVGKNAIEYIFWTLEIVRSRIRNNLYLSEVKIANYLEYVVYTSRNLNGISSRCDLF